MSDFHEYFNENSKLTLRASIERDKKTLDRDKAELFGLFEQQEASKLAEYKDDLERHRPANIARAASSLIKQQSPELRVDPPPYEPPVHSREVHAMMKRAENENLPLDQLTPHSHREQFIQKGYFETQRYERDQIAGKQQESDELSRYHLSNLMNLSIEDYQREFRDRSQSRQRDERAWGKDGRKLKDEFDRHR